MNIKTNITAGTLICIPSAYAIDEPNWIFDEKLDRYTLVALTDIRGNKLILGAPYLRPANIKENLASVKDKFNDIELALERLLE